MTVTADNKSRVTLPMARPGERYDVLVAGDGKYILTRLDPTRETWACVRIEKRGRYSVGVLDRPINTEALKEALNS